MLENTVKVHVSNILKKLNAASRTHAAFVANRLFGHNAEPVALPNSLRQSITLKALIPPLTGNGHRQDQG
jgi:hypothetical protein